MSVTDLAKSNVTAVNTLGTTPIPVIGRNSTRTGITFHNPGQNTVVVFPEHVLGRAFINGHWQGANIKLVPSLNALGGGFVLAFGSTLFIGEPTAQQAWQALALAGANNPLTIQEQG
jgi:hypothetical protein